MTRGVPRAFAVLPRSARLLVAGRAALFPHHHLVSRVEGRAVVELGSGHGLLSVLAAQALPGRTVVGLDPDARKVAQARAVAERVPQVEFHGTPAAEFAAQHPGRFDTVLIADVLYLLPEPDAAALLRAARRLLKPHGLLLAWEACDDGSWRATRAWLQENVMVRLLRLTHGATVRRFSTAENLCRVAERAGFRLDEVERRPDRARTPHLLLAARAV